ncbi:MAG: 2-hydroxyacyl-CoA dehydratase [Candidatus Coatesbacteria bacterium]|nr:MAG: 2-hydroxyacyl-CoA dehydratase [Candidatus Coatesbacteria bacterium]
MLPIEVILGAGSRPVDLNNLFIGGADPGEGVRRAERAGFPRNCCSWTKGIFDIVISHGIKKVVGVTGGDCSNTIALMETLEDAGVEVIPFAFPHAPDRDELTREVERLAGRLGYAMGAAHDQYEALAAVRQDLAEIDRLTWEENRITGSENHDYLLAASDMGGGDADGFAERVDGFLTEAKARKPSPPETRLGLLGVPPVFSGLFDFLTERGAGIVYDEIPRQFAMVSGAPDLISAYAEYTYPYGVWARLKDIKKEVKKRGIVGVINYVQSFCYRHIEDALIRRHLDVPVLTLEGDRPGPLSAQAGLRLECFLEMLGRRRSRL